MTYRVLARKYRPTSLKDVIGQDVLVQTLQQAISSQKIPHAILLHGIRGVGKTTTARIIARCLNCLSLNGLEPCNFCISCLSLDQDRHLDVVEIDAASRTGVDDMREIIESSRYKAISGRFKIFIIDEVHMLSKSAFNALLKTLEEPPAHVKFIFATTEIRKIPETILSRCMRFDLKRIKHTDVISHLKNISHKEDIQIEDDALSTIARIADGSMRDALSLLDQSIALSLGQGQDKVIASVVQNMLGLSDKRKLFEIITLALQGNPPQLSQTIRSLLEAGGDPALIIQDLLDMIYWVTCLKTSSDLTKDTTWPEDMRNLGQSLADQVSMSVLMRAWQTLLHGYQEVQMAPMPGHTTEMLLLRLCYMGDLPTLSQTSNHAMPMVSNTTKVAVIPTILPKAQTPQNLEELVKILEEAREPLLANQVIHDLRLISFSPGKIVMQLVNHRPNTSFISSLRSKLNQITGINWDITESADLEGEAPLAQKQAEKQQELYQKITQHPSVQTILSHFPDATINVLKQE